MDDPKSGKKPQKLKARLPRGLADRGPAEIAATREMVEKIRVVFERYGFEPLETPAIEYTDALGKFLPDQDRPNEGVFSFQDDDEQWLSLRYDLTAPLARYVAENFQHLALPYRSYRYGWVFRNEKPGPGRFRQFMQFDADTVGAPTMAADAEMCMLAADTMEALGIPRGAYVVKVNNRKILDGLLEAIGLGGEEDAGRRLTVLRAIDKFDRLGTEGVKQLLGEGRKDESGDFTKGAGLVDREIERVLALLRPVYGHEQKRDDVNRPYDDMEWIPVPGLEGIRFIDNFGTLVYLSQTGLGETGVNGIEQLREIAALCDQSGYGSKRIKIDPSIVRGLEYYTGPVFEIELLIHSQDEKGRHIRFGSVGGGGRYDGLVSRFMGQSVPATGFSMGVSRLQAALATLDKIGGKRAAGPVVVTVLDNDRIADYQRLVSRLRNAKLRPDDPSSPNISAELYLGNPKNSLGAQLKYAEKRNSPCVIIQGSDEREKGQVQIKDLIIGAEIRQIVDRDKYLRAQKQSQKLVSERSLLQMVRKVFALHRIAPYHSAPVAVNKPPAKKAQKPNRSGEAKKSRRARPSGKMRKGSTTKKHSSR